MRYNLPAIKHYIKHGTLSTRELLDLLATHKGIQPTTGYINRVILRPHKGRPHPLAEAYLTYNLWDKETVENYITKNS